MSCLLMVSMIVVILAGCRASNSCWCYQSCAPSQPYGATPATSLKGNEASATDPNMPPNPVTDDGQ